MNTVNWLLVGAGDIAAKRVAAALGGAANSRLAAVCDVQEARAAELAGKSGCSEVYGDLGEALRRTSAEAVYIATPVWLHAPQALAALAAGKHVLVEKPLGRTAEEAAQVVAVAEACGRRAGCAYFRRFFARYKLAEDMLRSNAFGQVTLVRLVFFSWFSPSADDPKRWRVVREKSGGGPLADMGSHMFDVLIGLFGLPVSVYARCENLVHQWDVEDAAAILMRLGNGAQVTASFGWNSKTWRHEFEIVGTEAKLDWLPFDSGPMTRTVGRETASIALEEPQNVHLPLVEDFVAAVRENRPPRVPAQEALKTNLLLDAVYRSSRENREVAVPSHA